MRYNSFDIRQEALSKWEQIFFLAKYRAFLLKNDNDPTEEQMNQLKQLSDKELKIIKSIEYSKVADALRPEKANAFYFQLAEGATEALLSYQYAEYNNAHSKYLKVSYNDEDWDDWTSDITLLPGEKLYVKGEDNFIRNTKLSSKFFSILKGNVEAKGNISSLINNVVDIETPYCFIALFRDCNYLVSAPELPSTIAPDYVYDHMFYNNKNLAIAPKVLPATTLGAHAYDSMFYGCSLALIASPIMAPTELNDYCCYQMFSGCQKMVEQNIELPALELKPYCYASMFSNDTVLETVPELPAQTLIDHCYDSIFSYCKTINHIKVGFIAPGSEVNIRNWVSGLNTDNTSIIEVPTGFTISYMSASGLPKGWKCIKY